MDLSMEHEWSMYPMSIGYAHRAHYYQGLCYDVQVHPAGPRRGNQRHNFSVDIGGMPYTSIQLLTHCALNVCLGLIRLHRLQICGVRFSDMVILFSF